MSRQPARPRNLGGARLSSLAEAPFVCSARLESLAPRRILLAVVLSLCPLIFLLAASAQEEKPGPDLKAKFHVDFRGGAPNNPNVRPVRDDNFRWEAGGARVTMPPGEGKLKTAGVAANFQIKGDFEITASYEILKAEQPTEGYGVGVSLFVAIEPEALDAVSLARRTGVKGGVNFLSDRMQPTETKVTHLIRTKPAKATAGKLRIQRIGTAARFFVADGDDAEFVPIYQDQKAKKIDVEFGAADIRYFQVGGDAGDSEAALDMRLLDLTVRADELPGLIQGTPAKKEEPAWMKKAREQQGDAPSSASGMPVWLIVVLGAGAGLVILLALGLGVLILLRRRSPQPTPAVKPKKADPKQTLSLVCAECEKKLTVKAESAGEKIKCPNCGKAVLVPAAQKSKAGGEVS